ncbi:MAG: phosphate ABC transporter substrate-binding protein PstS family protein [Bacillota bacterium]
MKNHISKLLVFIMILCAFTPAAAVFADNQKIVIAGSTSVQPLSDELAAAFIKKHPGVQIEVQGGGSSVGVKSAKDGVADIGAASREVKESEKSLGLKEFEIALDGIALIVNATNSVSELSMTQIKDIYTGKITNWKEVGGKDTPIIVVTREQGSGTRGAFIEITKIEGKDAAGNTKDFTTDKALQQPSTGAVKATVANTPDAIGFISLGALDDTVKGVKVEGVNPTVANIKAKKYKIYRPFLYLTKEEPTGIVKQYIDFVLSAEGQKIVGQDFITVKDADKVEGNTTAAPKEITVMVNGKKVAFDVKPYIQDNRTMVPARQILEALGLTLNWDEKTKKVTAKSGSTAVELIVGSKTAKKDGKSIALDAAAQNINGRVIVPLRFIAENFGAKVDWNPSTQTVTITK